jgi:hypothetical protein
MKGVISAHTACVKAQPEACPNLVQVTKTFKYLLKAEIIAVMRRELEWIYKAYTMYRRNPTHCGLWIHYARAMFHKDAVEYAADLCSITATTQLYHVLRQTRLVKEEWKDLQILWDRHGNAAYFIGDPLRTLSAISETFL